MKDPNPTAFQSFSNEFKLKNAFKQFSLESERLESVYSALEERFKSVQSLIQDSHTRMAGKFSELDFTTRYLGTLIDHISQGIIFLDPKGIVTTYNPSAQELLQIPENNFLFHPITLHFKDDFFGFSIDQSFASGSCPKKTLISIKKNDMSLEIEVEPIFVALRQQSSSLSHKQSSSQPIQGLLILLRDITELKRAQERTNHHIRLEELGELAAHLAHEIRNPLGGIKGFASLLVQDLQNRPDLQQMASYIVQGADDLNRYVSQILQYSRAPQIHLEQVEIHNLIEEVIQTIQVDSLWNNQIKIVCEYSKNPLFVSLDSHLFRAALLNLFLNACQAMPQGGRLFIKIESNPSFAKISIKDTGVGISQENLSKIFSPFFTTKENGTGLGLAEVQKAIHAHHGWIDVNSVEGQETTFIITIPLNPKE